MAAGSAELAEESGRPDTRDHYRPQLDGLRAIAVYLVVAFHAGLARFDGGFIGVDVFFVLSGYLVTQLLLRDIHGQGRIGFARFYSRRYRRLLPASFVVLLVTAAAFAAVAAPAAVSDALRSIKAAFLYISNWFFIRQSNDYFGGDINASPVVHFWSLSIEEQFYAAWPLLLGGLYVATRRFGRVQWRFIRVVVLIGAACSLLAALHLADSNLSRAYYGTDTRAYQLLAGALLALTPELFEWALRKRRTLRWAPISALLALVALATPLVDVGPITRGAIVTAVTCALIVTIANARDGVVRWVLSTAPVVYLGQISYGTYLWHWPIIVITLQLIHVSPLPMFFVAAGLATGLASLSYQILERPVRAPGPLDRYRLPVIALGLTLSIVGALVLAPAIVEDQPAERAPLSAGVTPSAVKPGELDWAGAREDWQPGPSCAKGPITGCIAVSGGNPRILLMGDSNAVMLFPAFKQISLRLGATLAVAARDSCPWQRDLLFADLRNKDICRADHAIFYDQLIPKFDPDVVVLVNRTFEDPNSTTALDTAGGRVEPGTRTFLSAVRRATGRSLADIRATGRKVVLIEPIPYSPKAANPNICLSPGKSLDECRYIASPDPMPVERMYRDLEANDDSMWSLDIDRLVCPYLPICDPVVDGLIVKLDSGHITATYSRRVISGKIKRYLLDNGIVASR